MALRLFSRLPLRVSPRVCASGSRQVTALPQATTFRSCGPFAPRRSVTQGTVAASEKEDLLAALDRFRSGEADVKVELRNRFLREMDGRDMTLEDSMAVLDHAVDIGLPVTPSYFDTLFEKAMTRSQVDMLEERLKYENVELQPQHLARIIMFRGSRIYAQERYEKFLQDQNGMWPDLMTTSEVMNGIACTYALRREVKKAREVVLDMTQAGHDLETLTYVLVACCDGSFDEGSAKECVVRIERTAHFPRVLLDALRWTAKANRKKSAPVMWNVYKVMEVAEVEVPEDLVGFLIETAEDVSDVVALLHLCRKRSWTVARSSVETFRNRVGVDRHAMGRLWGEFVGDVIPSRER